MIVVKTDEALIHQLTGAVIPEDTQVATDLGVVCLKERRLYVRTKLGHYILDVNATGDYLLEERNGRRLRPLSEVTNDIKRQLAALDIRLKVARRLKDGEAVTGEATLQSGAASTFEQLWVVGSSRGVKTIRAKEAGQPLPFVMPKSATWAAQICRTYDTDGSPAAIKSLVYRTTADANQIGIALAPYALDHEFKSEQETRDFIDALFSREAARVWVASHYRISAAKDPDLMHIDHNDTPFDPADDEFDYRPGLLRELVRLHGAHAIFADILPASGMYLQALDDEKAALTWALGTYRFVRLENGGELNCLAAPLSQPNNLQEFSVWGLDQLMRPLWRLIDRYPQLLRKLAFSTWDSHTVVGFHDTVGSYGSADGWLHVYPAAQPEQPLPVEGSRIIGPVDNFAEIALDDPEVMKHLTLHAATPNQSLELRGMKFCAALRSGSPVYAVAGGTKALVPLRKGEHTYVRFLLEQYGEHSVWGMSIVRGLDGNCSFSEQPKYPCRIWPGGFVEELPA